MANFRDNSGWIRHVPSKSSLKTGLKKYGPMLLALVSKIENGAWSCLSDEN